MKAGKKRKSRRVRMAEAVRKECNSVLFALGFRNPKKANPNRWPDGRLNTYLRWRGTDFDQVTIQWSTRNRAKFYVWFHWSRVERPPTQTTRAVRRIAYGLLRAFRGGAWFGPWLTVKATTSLLNRRLHELEEAFTTGQLGPRVRVGRLETWDVDNWTSNLPVEHVAKTGDPWLDPESDYKPD